MRRLLGGVLIAIGALVSGLSGLCSVMLIISEMPLSEMDLKEGLPIVGIVGGIPFLIGLAAIFGGRRLLRTDGMSGSGADREAGGEP